MKRPSKLVISGLAAVFSYGTYKMFAEPPMPQLDSLPWWKKGEPGIDNLAITKFTIKIPDKEIKDLKTRLAMPLHLTPPLENANFTYGVNTEALEDIINHWKTKYDWRKSEKKLNSVPHFKTEIEGLNIHFIHIKPKDVPPEVEVRPLLLLHGWPGSVLEFYDIFEHLSKPKPDSKVVFEVIAPSLPGFAFSDASEKPGLGVLQMSQIFHKLMNRLGHDKFYIQGGDWGSIIAKSMATLYQDDIIGAHVNFIKIQHPLNSMKQFVGSVLPSGWIMNPAHEASFYPVGSIFKLIMRETGYFHLQATKPDTLGVGLSQSPIGLAAYLLEKFSIGMSIENVDKADGGLMMNSSLSLDAILDNINLYWFTRSITTSMRIYAESFDEIKSDVDRIKSRVPLGVSYFQKEMLVDPPNFVKRKFPNLTFYRYHESGGHFAAMECPEFLANDIFDFVNAVESGKTGSTILN